MVTYTKPQKWTKEESERLRGEGDQIKFIDLKLKRKEVVTTFRASQGSCCSVGFWIQTC